MLLTQLQAQGVLSHALTNNYAILAVNADSPAAVTDCLEAAKSADAPIIIETSLWQLTGRSFGAGDPVLGMTRYLSSIAVLAGSERFKDVPVIYHTDHIKGPETIDILGAGIRGLPIYQGDESVTLYPSTISLDASSFTIKENISHICALAEIAKQADVPVTLEMESAVDAGITAPEDTRKLLGGVEEKYPGVVHLYAPGLGTKHGIGTEGYPTFSTDAVKSNIELIQEITGRHFGLALHGSSGLSPESLQNATSSGVVKVNWSSESLMIRSEAARRYYDTNPERFDKTHADWKNSVMDNGVQSYVAEAYIPKVIDRIDLLGGSGQGTRAIKAISIVG